MSTEHVVTVHHEGVAIEIRSSRYWFLASANVDGCALDASEPRGNSPGVEQERTKKLLSSMRRKVDDALARRNRRLAAR
jgi:hypothetical protein